MVAKLKEISEKSNILYSESLEGLLPSEILSESLELIVETENLPIENISMERPEKGSLTVWFDVHNFSPMFFLDTEKAKIKIGSYFLDCKLIRFDTVSDDLARITVSVCET